MWGLALSPAPIQATAPIRTITMNTYGKTDIRAAISGLSVVSMSSIVDVIAGIKATATTMEIISPMSIATTIVGSLP